MYKNKILQSIFKTNNYTHHFNPITKWLSSVANESALLDENLTKRLETVSLVGFSKQSGFEVLSASVKFADCITHIKTTEVLPLITVLETWNTGLRKDISSDKTTRRDIMCNALVVEEDYFVAPANKKV
ncbi:Glu-tRNAGln amidotransferase C subunit [Cinara cedri]|uniref:Glu-tRNAGln amidotransferase C subunit n=1 Tax=Cinara cedri TaxID=506608 RepID=A0A5E4NLZ7_9HEMI|nr:Glu-tRNAGln amidotransferase C subunit [Cinara cedri]